MAERVVSHNTRSSRCKCSQLPAIKSGISAGPQLQPRDAPALWTQCGGKRWWRWSCKRFGTRCGSCDWTAVYEEARAAGLQDALQEECNDQLRDLALSGEPEVKQLVKQLRDAARLPTDGAKVRRFETDRA